MKHSEIRTEHDLEVFKHSLHPEYAARMWNAFYFTRMTPTEFLKYWKSIGGVVMYDAQNHVRVADFELAPAHIMKDRMAHHERTAATFPKSHAPKDHR